MQSVKNAVLRKLSANLVNEAMAEKSRGIAKNFSQGRIKVKASSCRRKCHGARPRGPSQQEARRCAERGMKDASEFRQFDVRNGRLIEIWLNRARWEPAMH
jgi:hypothetical protein